MYQKNRLEVYSESDIINGIFWVLLLFQYFLAFLFFGYDAGYTLDVDRKLTSIEDFFGWWS